MLNNLPITRRAQEGTHGWKKQRTTTVCQAPATTFFFISNFLSLVGFDPCFGCISSRTTQRDKKRSLKVKTNKVLAIFPRQSSGRPRIRPRSVHTPVIGILYGGHAPGPNAHKQTQCHTQWHTPNRSQPQTYSFKADTYQRAHQI